MSLASAHTDRRPRTNQADVARPVSPAPSGPDARLFCVGTAELRARKVRAQLPLPRWSDALLRAVVLLLLDKVGPKRIASDLHISAHTVCRVRHALEGRDAPVRKTRLASIDIPRWLPVWLYDDYVSQARLYGEEIAARECRRLKREAGPALTGAH